MPLVEYKMERKNDGVTRPSFILSGSWDYNSSDHTYVGWVCSESNRNYYVPDTITTLTKSSYVERCTSIHSNDPYYKSNDDGSSSAVSDDDLTTHLQTRYDELVSMCTERFGE